ncbi:MAG: hypothetical protein GF411_18980 [Candidatus Lokiarchaeota archaeon]|nr:hypothetical protein [Candidatus Lokiarchaeota archaeon]
MVYQQKQIEWWIDKKKHLSKNERECVSVYIDLEKELQPTECISYQEDTFTGIRDSFVILSTGEYDEPISEEYLHVLSESRKRIWAKLFKGIPIPEKYDGAVEDSSGFLNNYLPDGEEGEKLLRETLDELDDVF